MEAACNEDERAVIRLKTLQAASGSPGSTKNDFEAKQARFDIFKELQKLRDEDSDSSCEDDEDQEVHYRPLILDRLVEREKLNTVILNLYGANKGFSLGFRVHDRHTMTFKEEIVQTKARSYEEDAVLRHVHNEQIPPLLLEALDKFDFLFYNGCVILEVRNHMLRSSFFVHHVLLRPTQQTTLADINTLTRDRPEFTAEDRAMLESQIVMAQTPDLCLDPDPNLEDRVTAISNRARLWHGRPFVRIAAKAARAAANRKRKRDQPTPNLPLLEFCKAKKSRMFATKSNKAALFDINKTVIPAPKFEELALAVPSQPVVINAFKAFDPPEVTSDCTLYRIEDHVLETDIPEEKPRIYHTTLSILYQPSNMDFWGEVYMDRDFKLGQRAALIPRFHLGTRTLAHRYVFQFTELFTDSGRKTNVRVQSKDHLQEPQELNLSSNAFNHLTQQRLSYLKEHVARLNRATHALASQKMINLNDLANGIYSGDFDQSDLYASRAQAQKTFQMASEEQKINALATKLELSAQPFDAAETAKRQAAAAAQQKLLSHPNMINLLHSAPISNSNSNSSVAVGNAVHSAGLAQQRLLTRRMTLNNMTSDGTRVVGHGNLLTLNNRSRLNVQELSTPQTVTLTSVSNAGRMNLARLATVQAQTVTLTSMNNASGTYSFTTVPVKQQVQNQRSPAFPPPESNSESALGALLVGTPAADRPEIASSNHANSLLLEKFAAGGQSVKASQQFVLQTSKANTVISSMSSPAPQAVNVQSLNLSQLQSLHNVQFQLPNFAQPISLAVNVGGAAPQGLVMSMQGAQAQQPVAAQGSSGQPIQSVMVNARSTPAGSSTIAHLVTSGTMKSITNHNLRTASGAQTVQLTAGGQHSQLISQLQRSTSQANAPLSGRNLQRSSNTLKMSSNSNELEALQHYQQRRAQQNGLDGVFDKLRRSSGGAD